MHELSLCRSIYTITDRAREGRRVDVVHLQIGQLRQVVPTTLEYCWGLVTEETGLAGSALSIDHVPIRLGCRDCDGETEVAERLVLTCGHCGSGSIVVRTGEEFLLTSLDLAKEE